MNLHGTAETCNASQLEGRRGSLALEFLSTIVKNHYL